MKITKRDIEIPGVKWYIPIFGIFGILAWWRKKRGTDK